MQSHAICLMTLFDLSSVARQCFPGSTTTRRHPRRSVKTRPVDCASYPPAMPVTRGVRIPERTSWRAAPQCPTPTAELVVARCAITAPGPRNAPRSVPIVLWQCPAEVARSYLHRSLVASVLRVLANVVEVVSSQRGRRNAAAKRVMMRATFGLSGDRCGADADDRRDADHEQQGPEQPAGGVRFPPWRSSRRRSNVNAWPPSG